jgi:crotonobetainyl-CoA:carnitine CoA-transferase CaiB-like acyl-CoA transferase
MSEPSSAPTSPLAGLRVVDLTRVLAGPVCGRILSDLGADVIKIEPPDGDLSREIAPKSDRGMSGLYTLANAGKRNVSIDLGATGGAELVRALYAHADVVLENFRPGVADRLGIGWAELKRANPRAIYAAMSGFGSVSAWRDTGAYAPMMHAITGVLDWEARCADLPVAQSGDSQADMAAGIHGAIAVLAALVRRGTTGRGERVEVPLFDALLATYSETAYALLPAPEPRDECKLFDAGANGRVAIAGTPQNAWMRIKERFSVSDPARKDDEVPTKARLRHAAIEAWMRAQPSAAAIESQLTEAGLAIGLVATLPDALHGPIARERGLLVEVDDGRGGTRPVVRAPYWFDGQTCPVRRPAPQRGQHNAEVLTELLGYDAARVRALVDAGVLVAAPDGAR